MGLLARWGLGPWLVLATSLRIVRQVGSPGQAASFYVDTARYALGFYGLCALALWLVARQVDARLTGRGRQGALMTLQLGLLGMGFVELAAFNFWRVTGTSLDAFLVEYALRDVGGVLHLITDSTPWYVFAIFALLCGLGLVGPALGLRAQTQQPRADFVALSARARVLTALGAALAVVALWAPPLGRTYALAGVSAPAHYLAITLVQRSSSSPQALDASVDVDAFNAQHTLSLKPGQRPKNIVIVILESTRALSVNPYQSEHQVTPFLEELARQSLWAERAYAVVPHTSKALVAILCGVEPHLEMPIQEAKPTGLPAECLAKLLRRHGYHTAFFQSATQRFEWRDQLVQNMGYEDFYPLERLESRGFERANYFGPEDAVMLQPSMTWLKDAKRPFLLTYLTLTPHHDYLAPRKRYGFESFVQDDELNRYLNTLRYVDGFTRDVFEGLKAQGLDQDTIFVVVGDHGEGFGEHGRSQHDNVIYEEGLRVPLIVYDPSSPREQIVRPNASQLDLIPTLLGMAGWQIQPAQWRGHDLRTLTHQRKLRAHCWYNRRCMAQIEGDQKFIHHFQTQPDEVFDLAQDPKEQRPEAPATSQPQLQELMAWRASVLAAYQRHYEASLSRFIKRSPPDAIATPLEATISDWARVLGVQVEPAQGPYRPGQSITLTTFYEVLKPAPSDWMLFMHGVDGQGRMIANLDHVPVEGFYPPQRWRRGDFIEDRHTLTLPEQGGPFEIRVGMWHKTQGRAKLRAGANARVDAEDRLTLWSQTLTR